MPKIMYSTRSQFESFPRFTIHLYNNIMYFVKDCCKMGGWKGEGEGGERRRGEDRSDGGGRRGGLRSNSQDSYFSHILGNDAEQG